MLSAGSVVAAIVPAIKYIPVEVLLACRLAGGGCWHWFTVIQVVLIYNKWFEQQRKVACEKGGKAEATVELYCTWYFRSCKRNFTITSPALHMRAYRTICWVWLLETWAATWDSWFFAPVLRLMLYICSWYWWMSHRGLSVACFVLRICGYLASLAGWLGREVLCCLLSAIAIVMQWRVSQVLLWLVKLGLEICLHIAHFCICVDQIVGLDRV